MQRFIHLEEIREHAGKLSPHHGCQQCHEFIPLSDAFSIFPHCNTVKGDMERILREHKVIVCDHSENSEIRTICEQRKLAIQNFLHHGNIS